jgi:hypothetical protein
MWGIRGSIRFAGLAFAGVLLAYLAAGVLLWAFQSRLIFEPERALHAAPGDFPFPVVEVGSAGGGFLRVNQAPRSCCTSTATTAM